MPDSARPATPETTEASIALRTQELRASSGTDRGPALERLGDSYEEAGKPAKAIACFHQAWELGHRASSFRRKYARSVADQAEPQRAVEILAPVLEDRRDVLEYGRALIVQAWIHWRVGRYEEAARSASSARDWLQQHGGGDSDLAEAWGLIGSAVFRRGNAAEGHQAYARARDLYRSAGNVRQALRMESNLAALAYHTGDLLAALERFDRLAVETEAAGMHRQAGIALLNRGELLMDLRRYPEAHQALRAGQKHLVVGGSPAWAVIATLDLARHAVETGEWVTGMTLAARCLERFRGLGNRHQQAQSLQILARAELHAGTLGPAAGHARDALQLATDEGLIEEQGRANRILGEIALAEGDAGQAVRSLTESVRQFRAATMPFEAAVSQFRAGEAQQRSGKDTLARPLLDEARAALAKAGAVEWLPLVDQALGPVPQP